MDDEIIITFTGGFWLIARQDLNSLERNFADEWKADGTKAFIVRFSFIKRKIQNI